MRRTFVLLLITAIMLTLVSCGKAIKNNTSQYEPSSTPQIKTTLDAGNTPDNDSSGTGVPKQIQDIKAGDTSNETEPSENEGEENHMTNITITVGDSVFSAKLIDNDTSKALLAQFPMTLNMSDLNGNEKYYHLANSLPSESTEKPATINVGDIMCWSGYSLVLFYKTFSNSYEGYVRLGYIEDASGLAAALGSDNIQVSFAVSD